MERRLGQQEIFETLESTQKRDEAGTIVLSRTHRLFLHLSIIGVYGVIWAAPKRCDRAGLIPARSRIHIESIGESEEIQSDIFHPIMVSCGPPM